MEHDTGVMENCVNIEKKAVPVLSEVIKVDPSDNLPDSSCTVSIETIIEVGIQTNKTVQLMDEEIHDLPPLPAEACIFKVHEGLRSVNEKAYTPILISIGPYHHGNPKLHAMEGLKLRYLKSLLQRINNTNNNDTINPSVRSYLLLMEKLAEKARGYYADPICLEGDEFVRMMLLDACFIIEFLRKFHFEELIDKDDPIFKSSWMKMQICRDLILLENQLPFFLLCDLFDMTHIPGSKSVPLAMIAFYPIDVVLLDKYLDIETVAHLLEQKTARESKHLLDLVKNIYLPVFGKDSDLNRISKSSGHQYCNQMSCVTELQEAGIAFKVVDSGQVSISDISFDHGHMKVPLFEVSDHTETFLHNIVAYEQHSLGVGPKHFTDYICFMDLLINSEKDVNALRLQGIMENILGDDEVVARMFNKLFDGVVIDSSFYYSHLCEKVRHHCEKHCNQVMAKLRRNYFNNPWAGISTLAAVVLLLLTLIQTAATLIPLFD